MATVGYGLGQSCAFCGSSDVMWAHLMAEDRVTYREYGKGHTLGTLWSLCDRCEGIYSSGDDDAAVEVMRSGSGWTWVGDDDVAECIRKPLAAFRRADLGARRYDPEPAALVEARRQGFAPLRELTGWVDDLGALWPSDHSVWLDELGPGSYGDEDDEVLDRWLVRSPWPTVSVRRVLDALWRWVERAAGPGTRSVESDILSISEFFTLSESDIVALVSEPDS